MEVIELHVKKPEFASLVSYFLRATHVPTFNLNAPAAFLEAPRAYLTATSWLPQDYHG